MKRAPVYLATTFAEKKFLLIESERIRPSFLLFRSPPLFFNPSATQVEMEKLNL